MKVRLTKQKQNSQNSKKLNIDGVKLVSVILIVICPLSVIDFSCSSNTHFPLIFIVFQPIL